ncbi:hypothetical protein A8O14_10175 [Polynucleobacter wuianus]|uniref:HpaII family restriction endonuclease n=1 Tax=Polynucleobacter wuianus TaxID=1743168 RepID=A0A191UHE9_9BURK|nr:MULTISPECIES: HpaII family restriction endonuclease [Polynucleobacter]ANJ00408.1 hypothetical protein A8O14_10175 [Polynucleobacter wuianus]MBU3552986.1 HpaII family restriction endonuclease [Polynucleobacter sp. MWH-Post4-6-1]
MNRGEWSEAYALLSLIANADFVLSDKSLADENSTQFKVKSILIPSNTPNKFVSLVVQDQSVIANYDGQQSSTPLTDIESVAKALFQKISSSSSTTFSFNELDTLWTKFFNPQIKATRSEKSDIKLEILDTSTQLKSIKGFSIKSNLGGATSLLNASQSTNFLYEAPHKISVPNITPKKLGKFVKPLPLKYLGSVNETYKLNLNKVDQNLESLISHLLVEYYGASNREKFVKDLLAIVANKNPLSLSNTSDYKIIMSKFLRATAFGMVPRDLWDGALSASGGMIIVKADGKLASFYLDDSHSNANLDNYLLEHSFFDTASTTRHDFGKVFDDKFFKFNLLIRL